MIVGDELRALRRLQREQEPKSPFVFTPERGTPFTTAGCSCIVGVGPVEHPFGTIKARMGATHFLMKTLPGVASEMALHVLAYNLTPVMNIMGIRPLVAAMKA